MNLCGIDPGKTGALVLLRPNGTSVVLRMPVKPDGKSIDGKAISAWLLEHEVTHAVVEKIGARGHRDAQGKSIRNAGNEFRFAIGVGVIHGCLDSMNVQYKTIQPMTWKTKVLGRRGLDKKAAIAFAQEKWPGVNLKPGQCRTPQDGIADAVCLADYGLNYTNWR